MHWPLLMSNTHYASRNDFMAYITCNLRIAMTLNFKTGQKYLLFVVIFIPITKSFIETQFTRRQCTWWLVFRVIGYQLLLCPIIHAIDRSQSRCHVPYVTLHKNMKGHVTTRRYILSRWVFVCINLFSIILDTAITKKMNVD